MSAGSFPVALSQPLTRALDTNSIASDWTADIYALTDEPTVDGTFGPSQDVHDVPACLFVMPYAIGPPDAVFLMRLWGWKRTVTNDAQKRVWVMYKIVELRCQACDYVGPKTALGANSLHQHEMVLPRGSKFKVTGVEKRPILSGGRHLTDFFVIKAELVQ